MAEEKKTMSDRKKGLKDEFSKIIWPSSEMVGKQSTVVIIISVVLAIKCTSVVELTTII